MIFNLAVIKRKLPQRNLVGSLVDKMRANMKIVLSLIFFANFVNSLEYSSHFSMMKIFKNITYTGQYSLTNL